MIDVPPRSPAPDVVGPAEARAIIGCNRQRFHVLSKRPDVPASRELEIGRVWDRAAVKAWQQARTEPRRRAIYVLRTAYARNGGKLNAAARSAGVHPNTARRWLRDLGIPTPYERPPVAVQPD